LHNRTGEDNADAHLKRAVQTGCTSAAETGCTSAAETGCTSAAETGCTSQIMGRAAKRSSPSPTAGWTWAPGSGSSEARRNGWPVSLDGPRRKRVLVKSRRHSCGIIGE
jgi:hypothetical protein